MCDNKTKCQKPQELRGKPEQCSEEQIKKCHGEKGAHPCTQKEKSK